MKEIEKMILETMLNKEIFKYITKEGYEKEDEYIKALRNILKELGLKETFRIDEERKNYLYEE